MKKINSLGFTLIEVVAAIGIGAIVSAGIASFMIVPLNINQTINNKLNIVDLVGELGRGLRSSASCKSMLSTISTSFNSSASSSELMSGLPISMDVSKLGLKLKKKGIGPTAPWVTTNAFKDGVRIENYRLMVNKLTLFGAESIGDDPSTGKRSYIGTIGLSVIPTEGLTKSPINRRIATVSFTLAPSPSSVIDDCRVAGYENHLICGKKSMVYIKPFYVRNGYKADKLGCINPLAFKYPSVPSDARLKKNVKTFSYGLKEVLQVQPYTYRYNGLGDLPSEQVHVGVIAQEVEKYAPSLVTRIQLKSKPEDAGLTSYRAVQYEGFSMMLAKAVQEQQVQIDQLQRELQELKKLGKNSVNGKLKP